MTDPYENLANAIVLQAVKDWRSAVRTLKKRPRYDPAKQMKEECERFFRSDWFEQLTGVDGSVILRKLKQEENIHDE
jgi:hypothetical protein